MVIVIHFKKAAPTFVGVSHFKKGCVGRWSVHDLALEESACESQRVVLGENLGDLRRGGVEGSVGSTD